MESKRYYWLKLHDDFFTSLRIKKLRKMAGGDTYTIIYLKIQLLAMKHEGILNFTGLEDNFADELALDLDENPDDVKVTVAYLLSCGLAETSDNISFFFPYSIENVGSEQSSAQRVRDYREKQKALHCNTDVTEVKQNCNGEIEKEIEIRDRDKRESNKPIRHKYGEYTNVLLTDEELEKFKAECPLWKDYIEKLSSYMASTGKPYKNHLATLRNWYRKDGVKPQQTSSVNSHDNASYDLDTFTQNSVYKPLKYERKK